MKARITIEVFGQSVDLPKLVDVAENFGVDTIDEADLMTAAIETLGIDAEEVDERCE